MYHLFHPVNFVVTLPLIPRNEFHNNMYDLRRSIKLRAPHFVNYTRYIPRQNVRLPT